MIKTTLKNDPIFFISMTFAIEFLHSAIFVVQIETDMHLTLVNYF